MKTPSERAKLYRKRKGVTLREKERERSARRRRQKMTASQKAKEKVQSMKRSRSYRRRKRQTREAVAATTPGVSMTLESDTPKAYKTASAKTRAKKRLIVQLPKSPRKRIAVVRSLANDYLDQNDVKKEQNSRTGLEEETLKHILEFYNREDISRWTTGRKDFIKVTDNNGEKKEMQKRYLICTLKELYNLFKLEYPNDKVGFSKFADMRPKHMCIQGSTPMQVCCCMKHENFQSLVNALAEREDIPFGKYDIDWVNSHVLCESPTDECHLNECHLCKDGKLFIERHQFVNLQEDDAVSFLWWSSGDQRLHRYSRRESLSESLEIFKDSLKDFLLHHITKRHQSDVFRQQKMNLSDETVLFHFDFSENYTCQYQDAVQSVYWIQKQVSIFTVSIYSQNSSKSFVFLSDDIDHSKRTVTVYLTELLKNFSQPRFRVIFWSDGPSSQFKNRFMYNYMKILAETFELKALEWNFFASSHGKGAIDGIGGTAKRMVYNTAKSGKVQILDAEDFAQVMQRKVTHIKCSVLTKEQFDTHYATVSPLLEGVPPVPGIKSSHHWQVANGVLRNLTLTPKKESVSPDTENGNIGQQQATSSRCKVRRAKEIVKLEQYRE